MVILKASVAKEIADKVTGRTTLLAEVMERIEATAKKGFYCTEYTFGDLDTRNWVSNQLRSYGYGTDTKDIYKLVIKW